MRFIKRIHSVILCIVIIALTCFASVPVSAETLPEYGTIANSSNGVRVRSAPGAWNTDVGGLATGRRIRLFELVTISDASHPNWYKLQSVDFPEIIGYVSAKYVQPDEILPEYSPDADFEAYLTAQKFPESYKPMLRQLHTAYPKWVFIADHLEMTWEQALNAESVSKVSLIDSSYEAWKSVQKDDYNLSTKTYNSHDGSSWFTAEKRVVAYYLDPRNFLNSRDIFQFFMQTYIPSLQNLAGLKKMVSGTFLANSFPESGYATYADVIMEAAKQSGVSPYIIASMILTEQGTNGQGNSISGTVTNFKGYYNFFNVGASEEKGPYDDSVLNGLYWAKNGTSYMRPWNSRTKAIIGGAKWYFDEYVNPNTAGGYTLYYKKFDVKKYPYYTFQYMQNIRAAYIEGSKLKSAYTNAELQNALEFRIPVYKNMPEKIASLPSTEGNNDNYLSSLKVIDSSNKSLINFSSYVTDYSDIVVSNSITYVNVSATVNRTGAKLSGVGKINLKEGNNVITVSVLSTSGLEKKYKINITREFSQNDETSNEQPTIATSVYNVGKYISGVNPETSVEAFLKNLNIKNGSANVYTTSNNIKTGFVGTGDIVKIYNSKSVLTNTYNVVVYGDLNSNGKIQLSDILTLRAHCVGNIKLSGALLEAADVNHSGNIKLSDVILLRAHYVGNATIKQR